MEIGETLEVKSRSAWRKWLARHHQDKQEIWFVYYKKASGKQSISYEYSVEEALCFGWIDGQMKSIDEQRFARRFSPRRAKSKWSESNVNRVRKLLAEGKMTEAGMASVPEDILKQAKEG